MHSPNTCHQIMLSPFLSPFFAAAALCPTVRTNEVRALGSFLILALPVVNHLSLWLQLPGQISLALPSILKSFHLLIFLSGFKNTIVKVRKLWRQKANFNRGTSKCSFCFLGVMFANSRVSLASKLMLLKTVAGTIYMFAFKAAVIIEA